MLMPKKLTEYIAEYHPQWSCEMPENCPPQDVLMATDHPFYRLSRNAVTYDQDDFRSYAELNPSRDWGKMLPLAVGLSLIDDASKAVRNLRLPMFRNYQGVIQLQLKPTDGVLQQTGAHRSHYTWWRTTTFSFDNLNMLKTNDTAEP